MFTNFQGTLPIPAHAYINLIGSYDGLIFAIVFIGAVYSDRVTQKQVRNLMQRTKHGIERTSSIFRNTALDMDFRRDSPSGAEWQELQALPDVTNTVYVARRSYGTSVGTSRKVESYSIL